MSNNEIALREQGAMVPDSLEARKKQTDLMIQTATYWAQSLMRLVKQAGLSKRLGDKEYLQVEGWQLIAEFARIKYSIEWVHEWHDQGQLIGYKARCRLVSDNGEEVGAGESSCGFDAYPCRGKSGSEKDKAAASAAQTWAISRAIRNKYSYIAKMGGYEPVPYEEVRQEQENEKQASNRPARIQLWDSLVAYCNGDRQNATELLKKLTGKGTVGRVLEAEAITAIEKFKLEYLEKAPDQTSETWGDQQPPSEGK